MTLAEFFRLSPEERERVGAEIVRRASERQQAVFNRLEPVDGYWDDEVERQFHHDVKGV